MTRILVFSDIHGSVPAVRALVATESCAFDAAVIAGDLGDSATDFFNALEPLGCQVLYVYGNWDYRLRYDQVFNDRFIHLHGTATAVNELQIVGFSGCDIQWGRNPMWLTLRAEVESEHRALMERMTAAALTDTAMRGKIDALYDQELRDIASRARDKRRRTYRSRVNAIESRRERRKSRECWRVAKLKEKPSYQRYVAAMLEAGKNTGIQNRLEVVDRIRQSERDPGRHVLVTHERLFRLPEEVPGLGAHFFGHRHGFKVSRQHGTTFVNVSALDPLAHSGGQYGVVEWTPASGFKIYEKSLPVTDELLAQCMDYRASTLSGTVS